jgi:uncharacterized repeat protein (TIGR03803 family)
MKRKSMPVSRMRMFALASALGLMAIPGAQAQTLSVVHNFSGGSDGANPVNGFIAGKKGTFFGTASAGGDSGNGVVFRLNKNGTETVLYSFSGGTDGSVPDGGVIKNKRGDLFGTTTAGGTSGFGTVYMIAGTMETVLHSFTGGTDGAVPEAGLAMDAAGNLYGTTYQGGPAGNGTVFKLTAPKKKNGAWTETVLYSFGTGTDGVNPIGGVTLDAKGNLYGTTSVGGAYGDGTIFEVTPTGTETILHSFGLTIVDGTNPYAGLVSDKEGNLYGAATDGGIDGGGTVFELTLSGGVWNFNILTSLPGWGISGTFRDLLVDSAGNVYGTTHCDGDNSAGTIYEVTRSGGSWTYNLLYTFTGGSDGLYSISNLVMRKGKLYGTTQFGGANGQGVIYELSP